MSNKISKMKNSLEGINSRLDKAKDQINDLEDNLTVSTQAKHQKGNRILKNE